MTSAVATAAGLVLVGVAQGAQAPPVIHEPFASHVLPCPARQVTTLDIEGCLERSLLRSDKLINLRVRTIYGLLSTSGGRTAFVDGERSWLRYRRSSCTAQASFYTGGSAQPGEFVRCAAARNKSHLVDLAQIERVLRQH